MTDESQEKVIVATQRTAGHAHTRLAGTYTGPVTVQDIMDKFYHTYFGGRGAWCRDGQWGCIRHDD